MRTSFFTTPVSPESDTIPPEARGLGRGFHLHLTREVAAPAAAAWHVLAHEYVDVAAWSTTTARSWEMTEADLSDDLVPDPAAPVVGRMLTSGRFGDISEVLVMYDEENARFRFATGHLPFLLAYAGNTQSVKPLNADRCRIAFDIYIVPRGPARLLSALLKKIFARGLGRALDDAAHYIETGSARSANAWLIANNKEILMSTQSLSHTAPRTATEDQPIPTWLNVMTGLIVFSNLAIFGLYAFFVPDGSVFPDVNTAAEYPVRFFAIRHVALSVPLLHGLIHQKRDILGAFYHMFLIIAVLDVGSILYFGWSYPFIGPMPLAINALIGMAVFIIPMLVGALTLSRK